MNWLILGSLKNPYAVTVTVLTILVIGGLTWRSSRRKPDVEVP